MGAFMRKIRKMVTRSAAVEPVTERREPVVLGPEEPATRYAGYSRADFDRFRSMVLRGEGPVVYGPLLRDMAVKLDAMRTGSIADMRTLGQLIADPNQTRAIEELFEITYA